MKATKLIQDAKVELGKAIKAIQAGEPTGDGAQTALTWLEAAFEAEPTEDEKEEIHHLKCLAHFANRDYDAARETFEKANFERKIPPAWQYLGSTVIRNGISTV